MKTTTEKWYLEEEHPSLRMWIFTQMSMGAVYGAVLFFGVIGFVLIIRVISYLLPEDPYAALDGAGALARTMIG